MNIKKIYYVSMVLIMAVSVQACKTKKAVVKPAPPAPVAPAPAQEKPAPPPPPPPKQEPAPAPAKPNYNFSNIQFEFNSAVLKTGSYEILDKVAAEMKKDLSVKFIINGHSSAEGSAEHNQSLSVDRANSVKSYLTNAGVNGANLSIKGYGESMPLSTSTSEEGRALNRRVEIKLN